MGASSLCGRASALGFCVAIVCATACGGGAAAGSAPIVATAPTPPEIGTLTYKLTASEHARIDQGIQADLVSAGYPLVTAGDADVTLATTVTAKPAPIAISINGKQKVVLTIVLVASGNGHMIDQTTTEFTSAEEDVSADDVKALIVALNQNGKLTAYANALKARAAADDAQRDAALEAAWKSAGTEPCAAAKTADACDKLTAWIAANGTSTHLDDAKKCVSDAQPKLAALKDEQLWAGANTAACKAPKSSADCDGVQTYAGATPPGAHLSDANGILKASAAKITKLRAIEAIALKKTMGKFATCDSIANDGLCRQFSKATIHAGGLSFLKKLCGDLQGTFGSTPCAAENRVGSCVAREQTSIYYSGVTFSGVQVSLSEDEAAKQCAASFSKGKWTPGK